MRHTTFGPRASLIIAPLLCLLLALPPALPAAAAEPPGAESPEALMTRLRAAAENEDFAEIAACVAPEDRAAMAMMMVAMAGMMVAFASMGSEMAGGMAEAFTEEGDAEAQAEIEAQKAAAAAEIAAVATRYEALLDRHGITDLMEADPEPTETGPAAAAKLLANVDQVALIADVMTFMREAMPDSEGSEEEAAQKPPVPVGELVGLTVDGDRARATVEGEPVEFVRVDGRWYVATELVEDEGGGSTPE